MFQGLLKRAERSLDQVIARVLGRALVAVPLLVAAGFATAALTVKLVEMYGAVAAYGVMAALFGVIGLATMAIVAAGAVEPAAETSTAASGDESTGQSEGLADATAFLTPEVRSVLASVAPMALPGVARGVGRNLPLVLILALIAFVISRFAESPGPSQPSHDEGEAAPATEESTPSHAAAA